jgi:hypothetical protein
VVTSEEMDEEDFYEKKMLEILLRKSFELVMNEFIVARNVAKKNFFISNEETRQELSSS